jgi:hypothetical protein
MAECGIWLPAENRAAQDGHVGALSRFSACWRSAMPPALAVVLLPSDVP